MIKVTRQHIVDATVAAAGVEKGGEVNGAGLDYTIALGLRRLGFALVRVPQPTEPHPFTSDDPDDDSCKICEGGRMHYLHAEDRSEDDGHGGPQVQVGQVWAGITGNRMRILAIEGSQCQLVYDPNPGNEDPIWESCHDIARSLDLVEGA